MRIAVPHCQWVWNREERELQEKLAAIFLASVRRVIPDATVIQMADMDTEALPGVDQVKRLPVASPFYIPWMMRHFADFDGEVLFLDTDIVLMQDPRVIFNVAGDVILTGRHNKAVEFEGKLMPFNLGVTGSRNGEFWDEVRDRVLKMDTPQEKNWWGAQIALWDMYQEENAGRGKWEIAALPMDPFNYTPKTEDEIPAGKVVLHYKGRDRKHWMLRKWGGSQS